ncbi:hypothetical protein PRZ48_002649 [Zasmidium cellare]|uniref:2EXR domain-containing protein n=1 Tax=Zasmidium cellare TaxID=395010 RepID=A0ABR0EUC8_ZASCE|nr:hypothetical protein PRZ48_002649 [Zasmidium cellare]
MENSPFKKLPAELRIKIYELVLTVDDPEGITIEPSDSGSQIEPRATCRRKIHFALIDTCKQVRSEAFPVFISQNRFRIAPRKSWWLIDCLPMTTRLWLSCLGECAQDLQSLDVHLGTYPHEALEWEDLEYEVTCVMKDIKAALRRYPKVKLSFTMAFKFPETRHLPKDLHETYEVEFYPTTFEQAKASLHKQCERFEQKYEHYMWMYDYDIEVIIREMEAYLESLDQDPTWSWGVQAKAPIADAEKSTASNE